MQIIPAVTAANFDDVAATCRRYPGCLPAWGMHPMYIHVHHDDHLDLLRQRIEIWRPVAVGEIGLDLFVPGLDYATQERYFVAQLKLAREYDLPVLLHCRRANDQILKHLRRVPVRGGIAHAFSGSRQQADAFIGLGFKLGFGGTFTWPRATRLQALAQELPLEAIVLETDSPDIPPRLGRQGAQRARRTQAHRDAAGAAARYLLRRGGAGDARQCRGSTRHRLIGPAPHA
ncbi:MAG: TatD family hydrolase [Thermochromatium sp.]